MQNYLLSSAVRVTVHAHSLARVEHDVCIVRLSVRRAIMDGIENETRRVLHMVAIFYRKTVTPPPR